MRFSILLSSLCVLAAPAFADEAVMQLSLKNHIFEPAEIKVPANQAFTIHIKNLDDQAEEFDSDDLKTEKVITGNSEGDVHIAPLDAGTYKFTGEYHEDSAHGVVIAQ